jgi:amidase
MSAVHAVSRSVRDSAALLDATAGPDLGAPYAAQAPLRPFLEEVKTAPGRLKIAIQRTAWNGVEPHEDCIAALEQAAALCRSLGHDVVEAPFVARAEEIGPAALAIIGTDTRATLLARAAELGRPLAEDDVEPGTWALISLATDKTAVDYVKAVRTLHETGRALAAHMELYDVVLSPTMATPPLPLGVLSLSNPDRAEQVGALVQTTGFTQLANVAGNPAMSVPLFWNDADLPVGVQFMGRINDEATLFRLAGQLEAEQPWFTRRPLLD